jgi:hypothetical protein
MVIKKIGPILFFISLSAWGEDISFSMYKQEHQHVLETIKDGNTLDPDSVSENLKLLYWKAFENYAMTIKEFDQDSPELRRNYIQFSFFKEILTSLEFRENKVDKESDEVLSHIKYLEDKVYRISKNLFIDYISWQRQINLTTPSGSSDLTISNKGFCSGGDVGYENKFFHYFTDACFLYGSGSAGSVNTNPTYQQGNIPAYGMKVSLAAGYFVSAHKTEIGLKIPMLYSLQQLTNPSQPGYQVNQGSPFSMMASLYSRWPFGAWFFQTEFGKYFDQDATIWSLGGGYKF